MRLGLNLGYWGGQPADATPLVLQAERLGFDSVWTAEAYGSDGITPLAWMGALTERIKLGTAILQIPARTPAMTAMSAATLDLLSHGRVLLGLGVSGPQVVEGWHGQLYGKPLERTREYVEILRMIWARKDPVQYTGNQYQIPVRGGNRARQALKTYHPPSAFPYPYLSGSYRAKEHRAGRRDCRRLATRLLFSGPGGRSALRAGCRTGETRRWSRAL